MCGNDSRTSLGGTIAILKAMDNVHDISLLFNTNDSASTTATFRSSSSSSAAEAELERCQIIIHRSGDLRSNPDPQDILHSFTLRANNVCGQEHGNDDSFQLPTKLDLGVGGDGVIGRRVSLVRRTPLGVARVLRQGIIGYN